MVSTNKIRLASPLDFDSIVDGPGLRIVVWTQGCPHHCEGCHNPQTWDYQGGELYDIDDLIKQIQNSHLQDGITLSGGEPFEQAEALIPIVKAAKDKQMNVWVYSGYTLEQLKADTSKYELLKLVDILVDGRFIFSQKDFRLWFKGSKNQRIIDVPASLASDKIILSTYDKNNEEIK